MVNFIIGDEVGWPEDGKDLYGTVNSEPNEMGEFYVLLEVEGSRHMRALDQDMLPEGFINYTTAMLNPKASGPSNIVITKPQEQSLWPYVLFMVAGGALILNI